MIFRFLSFLTATASVLSETDMMNLISALLASIVEVFANSDTTAVVSILTGA